MMGAVGLDGETGLALRAGCRRLNRPDHSRSSVADAPRVLAAALMALAAFAAVGSPAARYRQLLARKYGILGRLTLFGSRLRRGLDGTSGSA
jgi:hypothetical protein